MKKLLRGLFTTALAVGFLAGCKPTPSETPTSSETPVASSSEEPVVMHLVEFYEDNLGKFYMEVEVAHNTPVAKPADPAARANFDFDGWWTSTAYETRFDFETLIVADTKIYGRWEFAPEYVEDENTYHVVGDMANTDLSYINWEATGEEGVDWDVRSYLEKAEDSNLFSIELEIGYLGKFKVKIPGRPWDADTEFDFTFIAEEYQHEYLQEADNRNIQVKTAGLYKIEVETTWLWARVTRLGDAVGEGVRQDPEEGSIEDWGLVGTINGWGEDAKDISLTYDENGEYYYLPVVHLPAGAEIKLRADNTWGTEFGSHEDNELVAGAFVQATEMVEEVEVIKEGGNITVAVGGYYSVFFDKTKLIIQEFSFALRGDALVGGWGEDSDVLPLDGAPVDGDGIVTFTFEGDYAMIAGEFKVKFHAIGDFSGWDFAYGDGNDNFVVAAEGTYTVTLEIVLTLETMEFVGTAGFAPMAAE